jgi:hypothetical protein
MRKYRIEFSKPRLLGQTGRPFLVGSDLGFHV